MATEPGATPTSGSVADRRRRVADRRSDAAATVLSLTLPGDVLLYVLLPLYAGAFGVSLPEVGLLLAANRLIRIVGYGWVARMYQRHGPRRTCLAAALGSAASTLGYALASGVWLLLVTRIVWGLSFAAINIAVQALATGEARGASRRSGRSRAIVAVGPSLALVAGSAAAVLVGPRPVFGLLAAIALAALAIARRLPASAGAPPAGAPRFALPEALDRWSFVNGLVLDGVFVIGLAVLAETAVGSGAALAVGGALALRYFAEIVLGPLGGSLAERWGARRLLVALSLASAAGMVAIGLGLLWTGVLVVVVLRGMLQPLPPPVAAERHPGAERVRALARVATWRDIGAGLGPLAAGAALPLLPAWLVYGAAGALLALAAAAVARDRR